MDRYIREIMAAQASAGRRLERLEALETRAPAEGLCLTRQGSPAQSVGSGSWVVRTFDTLEWQYGAGLEWDTASKIICHRWGVFLVNTNVYFDKAGAAGIKNVGILKNGTVYEATGWQYVPASTSSDAAATAIVMLDEDDYVEAIVYQNTGGVVDLGIATAQYQHWNVLRVARLI